MLKNKTMKLFDFFKWCYWDLRNPREKLPQGITVYVSDAGTGKTLSVVEYLKRAPLIYPNVKIYTNIGFEGQDGAIETVQDLINAPANSILFIDEINLVLNSHDWKNVDPAILHPLTQHRKVAKQIVATAQSFGHINKQFRDFTTEIIEVDNWRRRWFFQKAFYRDDFKQIEGKDNEYKANRIRWTYNFVADNDLFNSYNTNKIVDSFKAGRAGDFSPAMP